MLGLRCWRQAEVETEEVSVLALPVRLDARVVVVDTIVGWEDSVKRGNVGSIGALEDAGPVGLRTREEASSKDRPISLRKSPELAKEFMTLWSEGETRAEDSCGERLRCCCSTTFFQAAVFDKSSRLL